MELIIIKILVGFNLWMNLYHFYKDKYFIQINNNKLEIWKRYKSWDGIEWSEKIYPINKKSKIKRK